MKIHTIGYNGLSINEFVSVLKLAKIDELVDIRERPLSRKKGFSKTNLANLLMQSGIQYSHVRSLGSPKKLRVQYQESGNARKFFSELSQVFDSRESLENLDRIIECAESKHLCLMCCCSDWMYCHRKVVVDKMTDKTVLDVRHIIYDTKARSVWVQEMVTRDLFAA